MYCHCYEYLGAHSVSKHEGVANKQYKLFFFYGEDVQNGKEWEFYDLEKDPSEMNNIYSIVKFEKKIVKIKLELNKLKKQYQVTYQYLNNQVKN